jgi:hypothetical protein
MRITDRAADEAARTLSITVDEARALLGVWIAAASSAQAGKPQDSGCVEYRGPRPWRLMMLVDDNDVGGGQAVVGVRASTSTRLMLDAPARQLQGHVAELRKQAAELMAPPAEPKPRGGRTHGLSDSGVTRPTQVLLTPAQREWCQDTAARRGVSVSEWVRTLVADAMEDDAG